MLRWANVVNVVVDVGATHVPAQTSVTTTLNRKLAIFSQVGYPKLLSFACKTPQPTSYFPSQRESLIDGYGEGRSIGARHVVIWTMRYWTSAPRPRKMGAMQCTPKRHRVAEHHDSQLPARFFSLPRLASLILVGPHLCAYHEIAPLLQYPHKHPSAGCILRRHNSWLHPLIPISSNYYYGWSVKGRDAATMG
jgi:hypothetical protein